VRDVLVLTPALPVDEVASQVIRHRPLMNGFGAHYPFLRAVERHDDNVRQRLTRVMEQCRHDASHIPAAKTFACFTWRQFVVELGQNHPVQHKSRALQAVAQQPAWCVVVVILRGREQVNQLGIRHEHGLQVRLVVIRRQSSLSFNLVYKARLELIHAELSRDQAVIAFLVGRVSEDRRIAQHASDIVRDVLICGVLETRVGRRVDEPTGTAFARKELLE